MIFRTLRRIISISILVFIFVPGLPIRLDIPPHRAAAVSFTLYGRITPLASAGWGTSAATTKSPGPTLVVSPSDSVTMSLFSADGVGHTFCIDLEAVPYRVHAKQLTGNGSRTFSEMRRLLGPPRIGESEIEERHKNIAYAVQSACEVAMLSVVRLAIEQTRCRNRHRSRSNWLSTQ